MRLANVRLPSRWFLLAIMLLLRSRVTYSDQRGLDLQPDKSRLGEVERQLQSVAEENRRLAAEVDTLKDELASRPPELTAPSQPVSPPGVFYSTIGEPSQAAYRTGYDKGFFIAPVDPKESPFSLKINNQNTFRYSGFARDANTWTDSAGNVNSIFNSSTFMIPRGRLIFSGMVFSPQLSYLLNIDYNTVSSNPIGFRAYTLNYEINRALTVHVGQNKVPGSREWLASSWDAQEGPDRSMATTFFRPSLSQGIWFTGEPIDGIHYHTMLSNGFNTINLTPSQLDNRLCFSESVWWEPWGEFGRGYSDIQDHQDPVIRIGSSFTYTKERGSQASDTPENTSVRLSDGTPIIQLGALAPGVTLQSFQLALGAIDVSFKHRGFSLSSEMYLQDCSSLQGDGPVPLSAVQAYGGVVQGGYFIVPQTTELYSRCSFVTGEYGSGSELGTGLNWFIVPGQSNLRFTLDAAWLDSSPADQNRTGFVAGQSGLLVRSQINLSF